MSGVDHIASRIREFAKHVDNPDDWMIVVPVDDYNDVKAALDTTKNHGTYYEGIVLCYGDGYDETQVKLKTALESYLQRVDTGTEQEELQ
ncbi:hypothetical protein NDI85_21250 [Halomicroarcula sp. S1AR25-4]|uniref:hypothetical protein n=1 Tax=Haloarcula sp. S1AR25-4 TaxID=2950538 RepID=UPI00287639A6|nr:hypothetical protein [Halomicroarcula sp. S1AR25-4]MDS0280315.1 hypothetical protein [Halomicroarcula sp. S1AR25-4]